ncbi:unnamed protein product, partial [Nesidiocoris tenuis]
RPLYSQRPLWSTAPDFSPNNPLVPSSHPSSLLKIGTGISGMDHLAEHRFPLTLKNRVNHYCMPNDDIPNTPSSQNLLMHKFTVEFPFSSNRYIETALSVHRQGNTVDCTTLTKEGKIINRVCSMHACSVQGVPPRLPSNCADLKCSGSPDLTFCNTSREIEILDRALSAPTDLPN